MDLSSCGVTRILHVVTTDTRLYTRVLWVGGGGGNKNTTQVIA